MQRLMQSTQKTAFLQCRMTFLATGEACAHPLPADEHVINICFPTLLTGDQQIPVNSLRAQTVAVTTLEF